MNKFDILRRPVITEKSQAAREKNEYVFEVDRRANKIEIKNAVESQFGVKVLDVRTSLKKPELKIKKGQKYLTSKVKKATIKIKDGTLGI